MHITVPTVIIFMDEQKDVWSYMCLLCGDPILLVSNRRGSIQQADDLLALYNCQTKVGNYTEASNTARQLLSLSSQVT